MSTYNKDIIIINYQSISYSYNLNLIIDDNIIISCKYADS